MRAYANVSEARDALGRYIDGFYNSRRPHSCLDGRTRGLFYRAASDRDGKLNRGRDPLRKCLETVQNNRFKYTCAFSEGLLDYFFPIILYAFICIPLGGFLYFCIYDNRRNTLPKDLKTFKMMKAAFLSGSPSDWGDRRRHSATFAMREFARNGATSEEQEEIARLISNAIAQIMNRTDNMTANDVSNLLETLAASNPTWETEFLEKVISSKIEPWARGRAIQRLVRIRGRNSLDFLLLIMNNMEISEYAAKAVAKLGKSVATPEVIARLRGMLDETTDDWAPSAAAQALVALGHSTDPTLALHADKLLPWTNFVIKVHIAGLDAEGLIERFAAAGVVDSKGLGKLKAATLKKVQKLLDSGDGFCAVEQFLRPMRAAYIFDVEWDPSPDYNELLIQLSKILPDNLKITEIASTIERGVFRSIECKIAGHPACIVPKYDGDWTDIDAVLMGLNSALGQSMNSERFACLDSGSQIAYVIVANAERLANLVAALGLPVLPILGDSGARQASSIN